MDPGAVLAGVAWISGVILQVYLTRQRWAGPLSPGQEQDQALGLDRIAAWRMAAAALELQGVQDLSDRSPFSLEGAAGHHRVRFRDSGVARSVTTVTISGNSGITLRPESLVTALDKRVGMSELQLGDEAFDSEVYVRGDPPVLRALLDAETRRVVRELLRGDILVYGMQTSMTVRTMVLDGQIQADVRENELLIDELPGIAATLLAAARRLERPADLAGRLAENNRHEPEWRVRLANTLLLSSRYANHPATRDALQAALQDGHNEVRLAAALALGGEEGVAVLLQIASQEWTEDTCAARAVTGLGPRLSRERGLELLARALRMRRMATACACLAALGENYGPSVLDSLGRVLAGENAQLAAAAARALGASGAAAAEGPLVAALARDSLEVCQAAAEALGGVGSASAVPALGEAAVRDARLSRAARHAIAQIQARLSGAAPGQLSLAGGDAGRLSFADEDPRGRVSLAESPGAPPQKSGGE